MLHALLVSSTKELPAGIGLEPHTAGGSLLPAGLCIMGIRVRCDGAAAQKQGDCLSNAYKGYIVCKYVCNIVR